MTHARIQARPHPFDGISWLLEPLDRKAASWLKRHKPAHSTSHAGHPFPILVLRGSQLIELVAQARAAKVILAQR